MEPGLAEFPEASVACPWDFKDRHLGHVIFVLAVKFKKLAALPMSDQPYRDCWHHTQMPSYPVRTLVGL
jgi:hypothetical protein